MPARGSSTSSTPRWGERHAAPATGRDNRGVTENRAVREPKQQRTRETWDRVLEVGLGLFIDGGLEALTVSEVCRRTGMSPPSLYARVDGRAGLIAAVYEHAMVRIHASDAAMLAGIPGPDAPREERIAAVVTAASDQFRTQADLLRPIIAASLQDEWVHRRGVEEARTVIVNLAAALALPGDAGRDIATMLFSELVISTMYGVDFASPFAPSEDAVRDRLIRMATARADAA